MRVPKPEASVHDFRVDLDGALSRLQRFIVALHIEQTRSHVEETRGRFRTNPQRFFVLIERVLIALPGVLDCSDVVQHLEKEWILLHRFAIVALGFRQFLALVINKAETIERRRIVSIVSDRLLVFDDGVFI